MTPDFDPDRPLSDAIMTVSNATLVPVTAHPTNHSPRPGGVLDADGSYLEASACYYTERKRWTVSCGLGPDAQVQEVSGSWLYGGVLDAAFGHCIIESFSRLWALDHLSEPVCGVAFLPSVHRDNFGQARKYLRKTEALFSAFDGLPPLRHCAREPHRFERLIVPPQGMGGGIFCGGCPEFRDFITARFLPKVKPEGGAKLYVSRTGLEVMGNILFEDRIEDVFRQNGYEIFHPEAHSLQDQVARYRAARQIVTVEGSALHLIAYALRPDQEVSVAIIPRRTTSNLDAFMTQFAYQTAASVTIIGAPDRLFHPRRIYGEQSNVKLLHDLPALASALKRAGFLADITGMIAPMDHEIAVRLGEIPKQMFVCDIQDGRLSSPRPVGAVHRN